ncbi:MSC_0620 family F1-like ATPase-associated subunit [Mycoplasma sp. OR1901]|uniref:MSC_0620 family F1-like ATPase-associated subunit n=1 Tax=Mycoplasma sp. OR1901 TaxID=2742195 RepID=UPI001582EFA4|nr:hypothetical protein [Mycoplasma sp. OR1901]QKT05376.1 hypothetical protein HTZ87_01520 [Mycoplasma sp. OR1901]
MSKKRKFWKFSYLLTSTILPISLISAGTEANNQPNTGDGTGTTNTPTDPKKPAKPKPILSTEFDTYDGIAKDEIKKMLKNAVGIGLSYIDNEIAKLEAVPNNNQDTGNTEKTENTENNTNSEGQGEGEGSSSGKTQEQKLDYKQRLSRLTYLHILKNFIKTNEKDIIDNPTKYEFTIIFPFVLAQNKAFDKGTATYNGKEYTDVTFGKKDPTDYIEALKKKYEVKEDGTRKIETRDEVNGLQKGKFQDNLKQYYDKLLTSIGTILYNEKDALEIEKDINLEFGTIGDKQGYTITLPKGYASWDDYFKSRIRPRFVDFDLTANQEIQVEEETEEQDQPVENPTNPNKPPKGQPTEPIPAEPVDPKEQILAIPPLVPNIKNNFTNLTKDELIAQFNEYKSQYLNTSAPSTESNQSEAQPTEGNNAPKETKEAYDAREEKEYNDRREHSLFYFDNPYNTRYSYDVTEITEIKKGGDSNEKLIAKVWISDRNDRSKKLRRPYEMEIHLLENDEDLKNNFLKEEEVKKIRTEYLRLYKALGIDSKVNYLDLKSNRLSKALFSMVAKAVDLNNSKDFDDKRTEINSTSDDAFYTSNELWGYTLNELRQSKVNNALYYESIYNAYEEQIVGFWGVAIKDESEPYRAQIIKDWESQNFNLNVLNDLYNLVRYDLYKLNSTIKTSSFNLNTWYDSFIDSLTTLAKHERILNEITRTKDLSKQEVVEEFKKYYNEAIEVLGKESETKSDFLRDFGIFLLSIGALGTLINLIVSLIKFSKKTKQIKKLYLLIGISLAIVLVAGAILLSVGLGVKGI